MDSEQLLKQSSIPYNVNSSWQFLFNFEVYHQRSIESVTHDSTSHPGNISPSSGSSPGPFNSPSSTPAMGSVGKKMATSFTVYSEGSASPLKKK
jgi:hypothetical protein